MKRKLLAAFLLLPGLARAEAPAPGPAATGPVAPAPVAKVAPNPAIWLVSDADTRIYLFGTVHALRPDLRWRSAAFDRVAREAEELVMEVSDRELAARGPNPFAMMLMRKSVPIVQRASPDRRAGLARMLREMEIPEDTLDNLETWGAAALLGFAQAGRDWGGSSSVTSARPEAGVEAVLMREFRARGRAISGAESAAEVLASFRGMPLSEQRAMLDEAVDFYLNRPGAVEPFEAGWVGGNLDSIVAALTAIPPRLYERLITRRNRNFADWIARRLDRPGTVLFAIGVGHLAGPDSVQSMLESRGLRAQRLY